MDQSINVIENKFNDKLGHSEKVFGCSTRLFTQLISVIKGEMSLIGPRPERPEMETFLKEKILIKKAVIIRILKIDFIFN